MCTVTRMSSHRIVQCNSDNRKEHFIISSLSTQPVFKYSCNDLSTCNMDTMYSTSL